MKFNFRRWGISFVIGAILATGVPTYALSDQSLEKSKITFITEDYDIDGIQTKEDFYSVLTDICMDFTQGLYTNASSEEQMMVEPFVDFNPQNYTRFYALCDALEKKAQAFQWNSDFDKAYFLYKLENERLLIEKTPIQFSDSYYMLPYIFNYGYHDFTQMRKEDWVYLMGRDASGVKFVQNLRASLELQKDETGHLPYFLCPAFYYTTRNCADEMYQAISSIEQMRSNLLANIALSHLSEEFTKSQLDEYQLCLEQLQEALQSILDEVETSATYHEENGTTRIDKETYVNLSIPYTLGEKYSPEDIFNTGKKEVSRIQIELIHKLREMGYQGDLKSQINQFKADSVIYDQTTSVPRFQDIMEHLKAQLPKYFYVGSYPGYLPAIVPKEGKISYYSAWDNKGGMKGMFMPATADHPDYLMETLTVHETMFGHHLERQSAMNIRKQIPQNQQLRVTAFIEGWALYSEHLAREEGLFESDRGYVGSLLAELLRAGRLVTDVGINYYGWSDQKAIDYIAQETFDIHPETEVNRYKTMPGQALAYKMGELKFIEVREALKAKLGDAFDIKDFHYEMLEYPSVPLSLFDDLVEDLIPIK